MQTILIVEDDLANRKFLSAYLQMAGYDVKSVDSAKAALVYIQEHLPSLVLTDIRLPGMDGLTLTRQIKGDPTLAHIPIIAITAQAMPGDSDKVKEAGYDGYISKPINFALLQGYLERYLDQSKRL